MASADGPNQVVLRRRWTGTGDQTGTLAIGLVVCVWAWIVDVAWMGDDIIPVLPTILKIMTS